MNTRRWFRIVALTLAVPLLAGATWRSVSVWIDTDVRTTVFANGQPRERREYRDGREHGVHRGWYPNGARRFVYHYVHGVMHGIQQEWYDSGEPYTRFEYVNGSENGRQRMWARDGSLRANYVVRDGRRFGLQGTAGCAGMSNDNLPFYRTAERTPEWITPTEAASPTMHRVAPFGLRNQYGAHITDSLLTSGVTVAHFFFTECGRVCPRSVHSMQQLLTQLGDSTNVRVLSLSVQPEQDSVAALSLYATHRGITDARWHLLTGSRGDMERLATASFFVNLNDGRSYGTNDLRHTETVVLIDADRRLRGLYNVTLALDMDQLAKDIRALLATQAVLTAERTAITTN